MPRTKKWNVGYATATMDLPHGSHFRLLKAFKQQCEFLIIGLTTDACAERQKRRPIMSFMQRRAIIENCRYVDLVVEHDGQTKSEAWAKLKFDVLLSSDEYEHTPEFDLFRDFCPLTPLFFVPKITNELGSTTAIAENVFKRLQETSKILCFGLTGPIMLSGFQPFFVSKPLHFAVEEVAKAGAEESTADAFGFFARFDQLPRNYKEKSVESKHGAFHFPMIAGVATSRELSLNRRFKGRPWCTYVTDVEIYRKAAPLPKAVTQDIVYTDLLDFSKSVAIARQFPAVVRNLIQTDGGPTLQTWCETVCSSVEMFREKCLQVEEILQSLRSEGVSHEDCHSRNVLIHPKTGQPSLIDFGWSMSRSFQMCGRERAVLEQHLSENRDLEHWRKSMLVCPAMSAWLQREQNELGTSSVSVHTTGYASF